MQNFSNILGPNNHLIVGVDLKKDKSIIERAYNDSEGVTELFNKNILNGLNKKFNTSFDSNNFNHKAFFNNEKSRVEMHLVSNKEHSVDFINNPITFKIGESIHTENSYKYSVENFKKLAESAQMEIKKVLKDKKSFFGIFFESYKYLNYINFNNAGSSKSFNTVNDTINNYLLIEKKYGGYLAESIYKKKLIGFIKV